MWKQRLVRLESWLDETSKTYVRFFALVSLLLMGALCLLRAWLSVNEAASLLCCILIFTHIGVLLPLLPELVRDVRLLFETAAIKWKQWALSTVVFLVAMFIVSTPPMRSVIQTVLNFLTRPFLRKVFESVWSFL